jgi:hypothetical protein
MKSIKNISMLVALLVGGASTQLLAGDGPISNPRDCVRMMNANFRECAGGQQSEVVEKKSPLRRSTDTKTKSEDTQGFEGSCRLFAWWDFVSCMDEEEFDRVDKPSSTKKEGTVINSPTPAAK